MKNNWQNMVTGSIWPHVRKGAENYVDAYSSVEKFILHQTELRRKIKARREK
jgi:hypothetical protein